MKRENITSALNLLGGESNQGDVANLLRDALTGEPEVVEVRVNAPDRDMVDTALHCAANTLATVKDEVS